MPTRKKSKKLDVNKIEEIISYEPPKSYRSLLYGALTVFIIFIIAFLSLKVMSQRMTPSIGESGIHTENLENVYIVKPGDSLWTIAEAKYNNGDKWVEIAKANNLTDPSGIEKGMKLVLPNIGVKVAIAGTNSAQTQKKVITPTAQPKKPTVQPAENDSNYKIYGSSYTVAEGDNLWDIAVRAYGDGYKWVEIAKVNKLDNPDLIYPGDKFILPR